MSTPTHSTAVSTLLLVLTLAAPAAAAPLTFLSVDDLARESDACVVARVTDARVGWNADRTVIVTTFVLDAVESLSGDLPPGPLELHRVGGELDGLALGYAGMPELAVGETAAIFLRARPDDVFIVSGLRQGVLHLRGDAFERDLRGVLGAPGERQRLPLEILRRRVRDASRGGTP